MAIRFTDVGALRGNLGSQLQGISGNLLGSHVPPPGRTAVLTAPLGDVTATMTGLFTPSAARTGTLGSTLDGMSCVIAATFTPAQTGITPPAFAPNYPTAGFIGIAGVRAYTDPVQRAAMGYYDLFVAGASWEGWATSGRNLETTVQAIKAASTAPTPTLFFNYQNLNAVDTTVNDPYPTYSAEITARNWFLFSTGTNQPFAPANSGPATTHLVNYTSFIGVNPSGESPYEFGAKYSYYKFLTTNKADTRFAGLNAGLAAPSMDGVFQDNFVNNPQVSGDWNRDGTADAPGFPTCAATPWLQAGQLKYANAMRTLAPAKYLFANAGDYGVADAGVMKGVLDGLLCESYIGKSWSWETQIDFPTVLSYYYRALDTAKNSALVLFGGSIPDTNPDGSALVRLPTANGFPPANTPQQWARYIHGVARLGEGMPAINRYSQGYSSDLAALDKYDEYGGIAGLPRAWLGKPLTNSLGARPTTARILKGPVGIYVREYDGGAVAVNPKGNGTQTLLPTDLPGSWQFLPGSQDPVRNTGAAWTSSIALPERDALFLQRATVAFTDLFTSGNLSHVENGIKWGASANTSVISTRGNPAPSLKFAFVNATSTAEQRFDLGATYTEWLSTYDLYIPDGTEGDGGVAYTHGSLSPANNKFFRIWRGNASDGNNGYDTAFFKLGASFERGTTVSGMVQSDLQLEYGWNGTVGPAGSDGTGVVAAIARNFVTPADRGKWMAISIYCKCATSANNNGVIQVAKNGILVANSTNLPCFPSTGAANNGFNFGYHLGFANAGFQSGPINMLIDNMKMTPR